MFEKIYLGTILMEKNRWSKDNKVPSFKVSEWLPRITQAGFDGVELWEYHATEAERKEQMKLKENADFIEIFNTYFDFSNAQTDLRESVTRCAIDIGAKAIKYNIGIDPELRDEYHANLLKWRRSLPAEITPICECHPGTIVEKPEQAKQFFAACPGFTWNIIVHPCNLFDDLEEWLVSFGALINHVHLQMRDGKEVLALSDNPERLQEAFGILRKYKFNGTASLEFTRKTGSPDETPAMMFEHAVKDLACVKDLA